MSSGRRLMTLARNVTTVGSATLLSRLLGFLRDMLIAAALGAGVLSDAYFAAFALPNLFRRLLAEGALNAAFVPVWLRIRHDDGAEGARRFGESMLGLMMLGLAILALIGVAFAPVVMRLLAPGFAPGSERFILAVDYARLAIPYLAIAGVAAVAAATLNAEGRTGATSLGVVAFNVVLIAAVIMLLIAGLAATPAAGVVLASAVVVAGGAQLLLVGGALMRSPLAPRRLRLSLSSDTRLFFALAVPGLIAAGIPQLKLMAGSIVASSSQAAVSWLYYANRLYELPLGVVSVAIAAGDRARDRGKRASGRHDGDRECAVARVRDRARPGAAGRAGARVVGSRHCRRAVRARRLRAARHRGGRGCPRGDLRGPARPRAREGTRRGVVRAGGYAHADAGGARWSRGRDRRRAALFPRYGHVGVAAAIALSGWVGAAILCAVLARRRWLTTEPGLGGRLGRIVMASLAMALVLIGLQWGLAPIPASSVASHTQIGGTGRGWARDLCVGAAALRRHAARDPPCRRARARLTALAAGQAPWHARREFKGPAMAFKQLVFSGVQPTGNLHLGNYLGAIMQVRRAAGEPRLHLLRGRPARHHRLAGPGRAAAARSAR